jgi:hypothetical protein
MLCSYKVPSRFFNLILEIENLQGDRTLRVVVIAFYRAFKYERNLEPGRSKGPYEVYWRLFD